MSTVQLVRVALRDLWATTFAGTDVQVNLGNRATSSGEQRLMIGNAEGDDQPEAMGPRRVMAQEYDIRCVVSVSASETADDDDQEATTDACLALYLVAEEALRSSASETLGVPGVLWVRSLGSWSLVEAPASETGGPLNTSYEWRVHVRARYQLP